MPTSSKIKLTILYSSGKSKAVYLNATGEASPEKTLKNLLMQLNQMITSSSARGTFLIEGQKIICLNYVAEIQGEIIKDESETESANENLN